MYPGDMTRLPGENRDPAEFPGIGENETVVREIRKPNGDKVALFDSGSVVVHKAGKPPRTRTKEGHLWTLVEGTPVESIPRRHVPPSQRPLNVASSTVEEIGRKLSNFEKRRFVLDGRNYNSVEGFYQGLKWPDLKKRTEIAKLSGSEAKRAGKGAPKADEFIYEGRTHSFGSAEHHSLIKAAIRASLEQNPEIADAFRLTHPRPIQHLTGRPESPGSALPGSKFAQILEEIRADLVREAA
jgi:hypothetical protein